ncbi:CD3337/EF1877 family mobilome membrane protein [Leuconostoc citreum]
MKRIVIGLAVLMATAFFVPCANVSADGLGNSSNSPLKQKIDESNGKKKSDKDNEATTPKNSLGTNVKNGLGKDVKENSPLADDGLPPEFTEKEIKTKISDRNMNWINANITSNMRIYHETGSITDFGLGAAHIATDLFVSLNLYIVYPLFDKALSVMFDLPNITNGMNSVFSDIQSFSKASFASTAFQGIVYVFFAVGLVWVFLKTAKSIKNIIIILAILVGGTAYINGGGTALTTINTLTSTAQTQVFVATKDLNNGHADTGTDFQNTLRRDYFGRAVERPFSLGNFGTASIDDAYNKRDKTGNPYRLMGGHVEDKVISSFANKNDGNNYISKDSGKEWYQFAVGLVSAPMSLAYGVPLLMIGLANMLLQLGAILLYYLAPFTIMMSLLPKFANSFIKTMLGAIGLLLAKIGLLFGIMFVSWVGRLTDIIVPPKDFPSVMLNAIIYIALMILLWKNKSWVVTSITGSSVANSALNKARMTPVGRRLLNQAGQMGRSAKRMKQNVSDGFTKAKEKRQEKHDRHSAEYDDDALRDEIEQERTAQKRQRRKDFLAQQMAKENKKKITKERLHRLTQREKLSDNSSKLPKYPRSPILKTSDSSDKPYNERDKHHTSDNAEISKTRERQKQERLRRLQREQDTNFNEQWSVEQTRRKQRDNELDKEL